MLPPVYFPCRRPRPSLLIPAVAAAIVIVTGCSGSDDDTPDEFDDGAVAAEAVGSTDGACDIPVTFDIADGWGIDEVSVDAAETFEQGGLTPACELTGRDAGWIGFIRVWTSSADDAEQALADFVGDVAGEVVDSDSRSLTVGGEAAFETSYVRIDAFDERNPGRAFAAPHEDGVVLVSVSGFDAEEYEGVLPAYVLARNTVEFA